MNGLVGFLACCLAEIWGFDSPARKWLAPMAVCPFTPKPGANGAQVEPIGVHDQLYRRSAVERMAEINGRGVHSLIGWRMHPLHLMGLFLPAYWWPLSAPQ